MNYDNYGFPVFDDDYVNDVSKMSEEEKKKFLNENRIMINGINVPKEIVEFYNDNETKMIKEITEIPVKSGMKTLF